MSFSRSSIAWIVLVVGAGAACHSKPPAVVPAPPPSAPPQTVAPPPPPPPARPEPAPKAAPPAAPSEEELFRRMSLEELNAESPLSDAFFDYDHSDLRDDARATLQRDAAWLLKWKQTTVKVEGHCDERGTAEYNLALGQRRADTVRSYLMDLGVDANRIATSSAGKEAPFCRELVESCFAQNRRGHFVITAK